MKKTILQIGIIGLVVMVMIAGCVADEYVFSFRNGISFGDSMETVQSKEASARIDVSNPDVLRCDYLTLSGISNSTIFFSFEYDKLTRIQLVYDTKDLEISSKDYETINEGLVRKYGQPVENVESAETYQGGAIEIMKHAGEGNDKISDKEYNAANQWVIDVAEGKRIIIEHVLYSFNYKSFKTSDPELKVQHRLTYQYFSSDTQPTDLIDKDL